MATKPKIPIAEQLQRAALAIDNTLDIPVIRTAVAAFGYDSERMAAGRSLHEAASAAVLEKHAAFGARKQATVRLNALKREAIVAYQDLANVARAVFAKTPTRLVTLGLHQPMPRSIGGFLAAAGMLFGHVHLTPELENFGYGAERLATEQAKIAALEQAMLSHERAKGAASIASKNQKAALAAMNDWVSQYRKIALIALRDQPKLLLKIGVAVGVPGRSPLAEAFLRR